MKFFFRSDSAPTKDCHVLHNFIQAAADASAEYQRHLKCIGPHLPEVTQAFVLTPWYNDWNSHDCPHDARLLGVSLGAGGATGDAVFRMRMLGAYHDRVLTFTYSAVVELHASVGDETHEDSGYWLADEIDMTSGGAVVHEVLWQRGESWKIVAARVQLAVSGVADRTK